MAWTASSSRSSSSVPSVRLDLVGGRKSRGGFVFFCSPHPSHVSLKHIHLLLRVITAPTVTQVAGGMTDASQEASLTDAPQGASSRSSTWPSDGRASPSPSISSRLSEASTCDTMLAPSPKRPRLSFSSRTVSSSTPRESYHAPLGAEPPRADRNETSDEREDRLCAGQTVRDSQRPEFVLRRG